MTERLGVHYVAEPRPRRYDPNEHLNRRHLAGKHNQKNHGGGGHGVAGSGVKRATAQELDDKVDQLQGKDPEKYWMVSKTHEGAKAYAINADDGSRKGYVALYEHDGGKTVEIGTLVAEPGARGVVADAMKATDDLHPNAKQKLDCFDGHLPTIYAKHGFVETGRVKWDDQYAPDAWKPEYGRPDVVFMQRAPATERRSRLNGASHQYDARHLAGKHDQKTHGKGGTAVLDRPSSWNRRESTMPASGTPVVVYERNNGTHTVMDLNSGFSREEIEGTILPTLDRLMETNPVQGYVDVRLQPVLEHRGLRPMGLTVVGKGKIQISGAVAGKYVGNKGFNVSEGAKVKASEYVLVHEWGHAIDKDPLRRVQLDAKFVGLQPSRYAKAAPAEAYAENFAKFYLSGGATTHNTAKAYAEEFGWEA